MWDWKVIRPKATENWVANPSFDYFVSIISVPFWALATGAKLSSAIAPYSGLTALRFEGSPPAGNAIASQALVIKNTSDSVYISTWVYLQTASPTAGIQIAKTSDGTVLATVNANPALLGQWQRIGIVCAGVGITNTAVTVGLICGGGANSGTTPSWDCVQAENGTDLSTYFDGSTDGCRWTGRPNLSPSIRPFDCRHSGVEVGLSGYLSLRQMMGAGMPPFADVYLSRGLKGGAVFQRIIKQPRVLQIVGTLIGTSLDNIHSVSGSLDKLLTADLSVPQKPLTLIYTSGAAGGKDLEIEAVYESGMDLDSLQGLTLGQVPLRFVCPEPTYKERQAQTVSIGASANTPTAGVFYKPTLGRGSTPGAFQPVAASLPNGAVLSDAWVNTPNGDLQAWIGGGFTQVGATAAAGLFTFAPDGQTLAVPLAGSTSPAAHPITCLVQSGASSSYVWAGGDFAGFKDFSGASHGTYAYLARMNIYASTLDYPLTVNGTVWAMAYDQSQDVLYAGGAFTSPQSHLMRVFYPSGTPTAGVVPWGDPGGTVYALAVRPDGALYCMTATAILEGLPGATSWNTIGTLGTSSQYTDLLWGPDGALYAACLGQTITPGPGQTDGLVRWNGGAWIPLGGRLL
jgi:hypothetical protein